MGRVLQFKKMLGFHNKLVFNLLIPDHDIQCPPNLTLSREAIAVLFPIN